MPLKAHIDELNTLFQRTRNYAEVGIPIRIAEETPIYPDKLK